MTRQEFQDAIWKLPSFDRSTYDYRQTLLRWTDRFDNDRKITPEVYLATMLQVADGLFNNSDEVRELLEGSNAATGLGRGDYTLMEMLLRKELPPEFLSEVERVEAELLEEVEAEKQDRTWFQKASDWLKRPSP